MNQRQSRQSGSPLSRKAGHQVSMQLLLCLLTTLCVCIYSILLFYFHTSSSSFTRLLLSPTVGVIHFSRYHNPPFTVTLPHTIGYIHGDPRLHYAAKTLAYAKYEGSSPIHLSLINVRQPYCNPRRRSSSWCITTSDSLKPTFTSIRHGPRTRRTRRQLRPSGQAPQSFECLARSTEDRLTRQAHHAQTFMARWLIDRILARSA